VGLKWLARNAAEPRVYIKGDSQLVVKQLRGEYKVKNEGLKGYWRECKEYMNEMEVGGIEHVKRERNKRADELANIAMDRGE